MLVGLHTSVYCVPFLFPSVTPIYSFKDVFIQKESSSSLSISWRHPNGVQPTIHYSVFYTIIVARPGSFSVDQRTLTVSPSTTSTLVPDLDLTDGTFYTFIITAVSNTSSESSSLAHFYQRKFIIFFNYVFIKGYINTGGPRKHFIYFC